jgi:eukaryotic-like serine/threonine-protein kinase
MSDSPRVLADRYELRAPLGRGGMGVVHRGYDLVLEREVAVKIVAPDQAVDESTIRRFRREARSAAALNHRHVVAVHDTGSDGDAHYIVMELVEGPTLADLIATQGPFGIERTVRTMRGVCGALEAAHDNGIVHRDVKPNNIMFDRHGEPKVADFGLALATTDVTRTSTIYGSAPYMAPEQARGEDVDHRVDIYALGCVLHEMLTGRPPFAGDQPLAIVSQHLHEDPPAPTRSRPDLPAAFDDVVLRCLAKDPQDRYPDAGALLDDLEGAADHATRRIGSATTAAAGAGVAGHGDVPAGDRQPEAEGSQGEHAAGEQRAPRSRRTAAALALALLAGAALLAILGLPDDGDPPAPFADEEAEEPADPEEPQLTGVAAVRDATFDVIEVLDEGVEAGDVSDDAHEEIRDEVREVVVKAGDDEWEDAFDEVEEVREKVDDNVADGEVSVSRGRELHTALDRLEQVVEAERPGEGQPSPSPSPGPS